MFILTAPKKLCPQIEFHKGFAVKNRLKFQKGRVFAADTEFRIPPSTHNTPTCMYARTE
jgi:hypothetical protein